MGLGTFFPNLGIELGALLQRTKAKEECARLEGPHGAVPWRPGRHKPVGEVRGDQTAESRNKNRRAPKGSFNPVNSSKA